VREKVIEWAKQHASIRAAIIAGSTERQVKPADESADIDFEFYVTDFDEFLSDMGWIENIAPVWTHLQIDEPDGPVFLVIYEGGEKVDFHFFQVNELERMVSAKELPSSYLRGYRVVIDKDGIAQKLLPHLKTSPSIPKPSEEDFNFVIRSFWFSALHVAKQIRRRNLWVVKHHDWGMKMTLLKFMEWYTQTRNNWEIDTWHLGHHILDWVDDQTQHELHQVFGHFEAEDSWRALYATMSLFRRLANTVADEMDYKYLVELDQSVTRKVEEIRKYDAI